MEAVLMGFLTAVAAFILMWKINLEFFAKYQWQTDVAVSLGLTVLFFGTFQGVMTAVIAGIFISIFLYTASKVLLY